MSDVIGLLITCAEPTAVSLKVTTATLTGDVTTWGVAVKATTAVPDWGFPDTAVQDGAKHIYAFLGRVSQLFLIGLLQ
jgi:hypothetical protein